jgi:hypothetical protein
MAAAAPRSYAIPRDRIAALLPPAFFACAVAFLAPALVLLPFVVGALGEHFYQAHVLAVTHMVALGWISMVMMGVLYRYVPGLTKRPLPHPGVALAQWVTFVVGVLGLVFHFWLGRWTETAWSAGLILVSAVLLCVNLWPMLRAAPGRGVAEVGILAASTFLVAAATLGVLLALNKEHQLLGGGPFTNLGAHVHLAALGWVGVTISALSFRFLPAFLLPTLDLTGAARRQVMVLAGWVVLLVASLLAPSALVVLAALGAAGALAAYLVLLVRLVRSHRMPIDWTARHALASAAWLGVTMLCGLSLLATGVDAPAGVRLGAAYGVAGLLGWMSNLVIGISYKLFPGFVSAARSERRRAAVPIASLAAPPGAQPPVFALFNAGVALTAGGLATGLGALALGGSVVAAAGGLLYAVLAARTLAFTVTDPRRPPTSLPVVP